MSEWYDVSGNPGTKSQGSSASMRAEFALIQAAFAKLPAMSTGAGLPLFVNAGGTALEVISAVSARSKLGLVIGTNVQAYSSVLQGTTASFTTALETKLGYITVGAPVDLAALLPTATFGQGHNTGTGAHKAVLLDTVATPTPGAGQGALHVALHEGRPELYWTGYGLSPLRMTYNGALNVTFETSSATFAALASDTRVLSGAVELAIASNAATMDLSLGDGFTITVTENVEITITNMPTGASGKMQCAYLELINAGSYAVTFASDYTLEWVGSAAPEFTAVGKDGVALVTLDGASITLAPLTNIGAAA